MHGRQVWPAAIVHTSYVTYRPEIDGLRALAVTVVVLNHAGFTFVRGGFLGVDIFFVISGFLITGIIQREIADDRFSLRAFYERRARRILPALTFVVVMVLPMAWVILTPAQLKQFGQSVGAVALFSSNFLFWQQSGYFDVAAELKPLLHTWSLAVEEQFYLLFPLLLLGLRRVRTPTRIMVLGFIALASLGLAEVGARRQWVSNFYLLPSRAWELLLGALLALFAVRSVAPVSARVSRIVAPLSFVAILLSVVFLDESDPMPGLLSLVPVLATAGVIWTAAPGTALYRLLTLRPMIQVGLMSYSIYLWHQPLFALARHAKRAELDLLTIIALIGLTFILAYLSYRFVERPFRGGLIRSRRQIFLGSAVVSVLFVAFGWTAQAADGNLPGKADAAAREAQLAIMAGSQIPDRDFDCHLNVLSKVDKYLGDWDCYAGSDSGLEELNVMVVGDSHAGVFAGAFLWNGFSINRASGSGCSILRPDTGFEECASILDLAVEQIGAREINTVFLVNYWDESELSELFINLVLDFWLDYADRVVLMAPVPEFPTAHATYVNTGEIEVVADFSKADRFEEVITQMELPPEVLVVDTALHLCGTERHCRLIDGNRLLWHDADHLAAEGSRRLGASMMSAGVLDFVEGARAGGYLGVP
jgi:peptidoglycan/LPS O-acetylase OafA/YrhL